MFEIIKHSQYRILEIIGEEAQEFLQGIVSCDVRSIETQSKFGAFLTPQGKFWADFILSSADGTNQHLYLCCADIYATEVLKKLKLYRLRRKIELTLKDPCPIYRILDPKTHSTDNFYTIADPRHAGLGTLVFDFKNTFLDVCADCDIQGDSSYNDLRLKLAIPESSQDLIVNKTTLLEAGYDDLGAVSYEKGCYIGQEVTARMHYRGLLKRKLIGYHLEFGQIQVEDTLFDSEEKPLGKVLSTNGIDAICHVRIHENNNEIFTENGSKLVKIL